jgi:hypothetical protein
MLLNYQVTDNIISRYKVCSCIFRPFVNLNQHFFPSILCNLSFLYRQQLTCDSWVIDFSGFLSTSSGLVGEWRSYLLKLTHEFPRFKCYVYELISNWQLLMTAQMLCVWVSNWQLLMTAFARGNKPASSDIAVRSEQNWLRHHLDVPMSHWGSRVFSSCVTRSFSYV